MRVISGSARGLKLLSLEGDNTRPTLDRVKEALFSMLTAYIPYANVLDLFAGSGALGIEALSRGADRCVFVDALPQAMDIVKANAAKARVAEKSAFHTVNALSYLNSCEDKFDIVFLDPPYHGNLYEDCLTKLYENSLIKKDSVLVMEWDSETEKPHVPPFYEVIRERKYGRVMLTLLGCID